MAADYVIQPYALRRNTDDEKFGFSLKPLPTQDGAIRYLVIKSIVRGSPAERAGLAEGMVVLDINNVPLVSGTTADAGRAIGLTEPGKPLMMGIKVDAPKARSIPTLPSMVTPPAAAPIPVVAPATTPTRTPPPVPAKPPRQKISVVLGDAGAIPRQSNPIDPNEAIVLDSGAWQCKIGFSSQTAPMMFPTIAGRHKLAGVGPLAAAGGAKAFYGSSAFSKKGILKLSYPYERGVVKNWDDMAALWDYAFKDELRTEPNGRPVLITEPVFTSREQREKMAQIMFETFEVSSLFVALSSLLGMYSAGFTNNTLVVDIGDSLTQIIPVRHDFNVGFLAAQKYPLAGSDVSERLSQLLSGGTGHTFTAQDFNLREIKEKLCQVAGNASAAEQRVATEKFTLPDGNVIDIGNERFLCTEVLFDPGRLGMTSVKGIPEAVLNVALKCDAEAAGLLQNIVVCGGSTMFPGFAERLQSDIKAMTPQVFGRTVDVNVAPARHGKLASWLGGVAVAKMPGFQNQWITRQEFAEFGYGAVHRKSAPL